MSLQLVLPRASRITVIDDDEEARKGLEYTLRDFEFEPIIVKGRFGNRLPELIAEIETHHSAFVICDNRLQPGNLAQFYGVSVVKNLVARQLPAMLLTVYGSSDRLMLRSSRFDVPLVVDRGAFVPERLGEYYEICRREIVADPVDERKPHRSLIRVDNIQMGTHGQIDGVISAWRPDHAVPIPLDCIAEDLHSLMTVGTYLLGDVNIGAHDEDDLYFHNVNEIAPSPKEELA